MKNFRNVLYNSVHFLPILLFLLLTAIYMAVSVPAAESPVAAVNYSDHNSDTTRIVCFGDSNTYGFCPSGNNGRYPEEELWTTILENELGPGYETVNEGLNGRTTAYDFAGSYLNGLSALPDCLSEDIPVDILIFMLGTNDCANYRFFSAQDIADGMEQLILSAQSVTLESQGYVPEIVLVVPAAIQENHGYDSAVTQLSLDIGPLYKDLADKYGCLYLDASESLEVSEIDGVHLTAEGHRKLAGLLYDLLTK